MALINVLLSMMAVAVTTISSPHLDTAVPAAPATPVPVVLRGTWPLHPHSVVRGFEAPPDPYTAGHRGVDLAGSLGAPVLAGAAGTVTFAGSIAGRGVVVINHGDTRTTYEPVIADVTVGTVVSAGDRIGTLDVTQSHCFPAACLHWGWIRDREYLDPLLLVPRSHQVRLLPLDGVMPADEPAGRQP